MTILESERQIKELQSQLADIRGEIDQTQSQIKSLEYQLQQRIIRSPIDGTIFRLPAANVGAVVQPDQLVAEVAPQGATLMVKAQIATTESGSLREGMDVKVKFDAYPFQNYGVLAGMLIRKSPTSTVTETAEGKITTFDLDIALDQHCIPAKHECIALKPGDTVIAEVIIRRRRVIDFILDPFKQLQTGGLKL